MSEVELNLYRQYAIKNMLPNKRSEFYMAQVAHLIAVAHGSKAELSDFLIKMQREVEDDESSEEINDDTVAFFNM